MTDADIAQLANRVLEQLERVPGWAGLSFRGMSGRLTFGREVRTAVAAGLVATSRDPRVASENFTSDGLFAIAGRRGRGIESLSAHPDEKEVVFLPGTVFSYVTTARFGNIPIVIAREVDLADSTTTPDEFDLDVTRRKIATAMRAALSEPAMTITSPGKYTGDLD